MKRGEIPSIGELTSFVAAAQHGSFTRAAGELNLTQGAISRQIRELEIHLGIRLFERIRQRVVLTDAGKTYLAQVKKALDDLADATQRVASFSNSATRFKVVLLENDATRCVASARSSSAFLTCDRYVLPASVNTTRWRMRSNKRMPR